MSFILMILVLLASSATANDQPIPKDVSTVNDTMCSIKHESNGYWKTTAIAKYIVPENHNGGQPFIAVLSIRRKLGDATADCEEWMKAVKREQERLEFHTKQEKR